MLTSLEWNFGMINSVFRSGKEWSRTRYYFAFLLFIIELKKY